MAPGERERALVSPVTAPTFLEGIATAVDDRIATLLDSEIARWSQLEVDLAEPLSALRSFILAGAPPGALAVFGELRVEVNVGQYLDLLGTARGDVDRASARRISLYKSGKYTVERPLPLGAALAGRLDDLREPLTAYGLPLGEAVQLRDDLLGVFGDAG